MNNTTNNISNDRVICRGGRSGTKVHLATSKNSSVTQCGLRLRGQARHFLVGADTTAIRTHVQKVLCEKCFGPVETQVLDIDARVAELNARTA